MKTEAMMIGHANKGAQKYQQITSATGAVTKKFYGFIPVNGDATLTTLTDISGSAAGYTQTGTFYQNVWYPGDFTAITVATGTVIIYLGEQ